MQRRALLLSIAILGSLALGRSGPHDPRLAAVEHDPALPSVLLIGDSISIGYTLGVREALRGRWNVDRPPENCKSTLKILARLDAWLAGRHYDVIHFNAGLHDLKHVRVANGPIGDDVLLDVGVGTRWVPLPDYTRNLEAIVLRLKRTGARLIFATTTPVPAGAKGRIPSDVVAYNAAALAVMAKHGVEIDDLNRVAILAPQPERQVHFTTAGNRLLAEAVAAAID